MMNDRDLLARMLQAEAGNQGEMGMRAVAAVINNRRNTPGYGGSGYRDVMMAPGQFSPANSITGYAGGDQGVDLNSLQPGETAFRVADEAMRGNMEDPTGGALNFVNPDISQPSWLNDMQNTRQIGDHLFGTAGAGRNAGGNTMRQPTMSGQSQPQQQDPRQELSQMFPKAPGNKLEKVAMALMSMSAFPTQGMQMQMQGLQEKFGEERQQNRVNKQKNKTVETLERMAKSGNPQAQRGIELMQAGGSIQDALNMAFSKPDQVKGTEINGKLVNPVTGELIADYSDGGDQSAAEAKIARGMEIGMDRSEAIKYADGIIKIVTDPVKGGTVLLDASTGKARPIELPQNVQPDETREIDSSENAIGRVEGALGLRGIGNQIANAVGDAVGGGLAAPEAEKAASNLTNLSTQTMLTLSGEWAGRPSNLTRERIEALTVKPNEMFTGPGRATIRFKEMRDLIDASLRSAKAVSSGDYTPQQRTQAAQKIQQLQPLLSEYNAIVQQLEGGQGGGAGQTQNGVQWRLVD